jgi:hypothetical protein
MFDPLETFPRERQLPQIMMRSVADAGVVAAVPLQRLGVNEW